jgi:deoxyribodipyrimidine photo-lyase
MKTMTVLEPSDFKVFVFKKWPSLTKAPHATSVLDINKFYIANPMANVHGGRSNGLAILRRINNFIDYGTRRDFFTYKTTYLASHNHFGTVSIREVYVAVKRLGRKATSLINELIWRDFYYMLYYYFPHMLNGMVSGVNKAFRPKYNHIHWQYNDKLFTAWCTGYTGIPICDAAMRQLNTSGFMPNRLRMIVASILTKIFLISWRYGEKYFAQQLKDYDPIQNSAGWAWTITGIDPQQVFRIFSPKLQSIKFDLQCEYIIKYVPELADVPSKDIHNWENTYAKYLAVGVKYVKPVIDYKFAYARAMKELMRVHKLK